MPSDKDRIWKIGDGKWENKEFSVTNSGTTVNCYFSSSGTDTSNDTTKVYNRYFALGRGAYHVSLRPSGVVTIKAAKLVYGALITFADPITVQTTGYSKNFGCEVEYMILETQAASVQVKLEVN